LSSSLVGGGERRGGQGEGRGTKERGGRKREKEKGEGVRGVMGQEGEKILIDTI